jgi:hypothetical protein
MKSLSRSITGLVACALFASALEATTLVDKSPAIMAQEASLIVTGRCTQLASGWLGRSLVTIATIQVDEDLKGRSANEIRVLIPGGIDANRRIPIAMTVPGAPRIVPNENVLLFLAKDGRVADSYSVVGFSQGKFSLLEGPDGSKSATQSLSEVNLAKASGGTRPGRNGSFPLEQIRREIQDALAVAPQ